MSYTPLFKNLTVDVLKERDSDVWNVHIVIKWQGAPIIMIFKDAGSVSYANWKKALNCGDNDQIILSFSNGTLVARKLSWSIMINNKMIDVPSEQMVKAASQAIETARKKKWKFAIVK
jgi:hypothetical protein